MASTKRALANNPIVDLTAIREEIVIKRLEASSTKPSSVKRILKQQALNVVPIIKRQARRFAMIDKQTVDRRALIKFNGPRSEGLKKDKVSLCVRHMK